VGAVILTSPVAGAVAFPAKVHAYDGAAAATYAGKHALGQNHSYPTFDNDGANFTSQVLRAGGYNRRGRLHLT
jgi:hypothetical protein